MLILRGNGILEQQPVATGRISHRESQIYLDTTQLWAYVDTFRVVPATTEAHKTAITLTSCDETTLSRRELNSGMLYSLRVNHWARIRFPKIYKSQALTGKRSRHMLLETRGP